MRQFTIVMLVACVMTGLILIANARASTSMLACLNKIPNTWWEVDHGKPFGKTWYLGAYWAADHPKHIIDVVITKKLDRNAGLKYKDVWAIYPWNAYYTDDGYTIRALNDRLGNKVNDCVANNG